MATSTGTTPTDELDGTRNADELDDGARCVPVREPPELLKNRVALFVFVGERLNVNGGTLCPAPPFVCDGEEDTEAERVTAALRERLIETLIEAEDEGTNDIDALVRAVPVKLIVELIVDDQLAVRLSVALMEPVLLLLDETDFDRDGEPEDVDERLSLLETDPDIEGELEDVEDVLPVPEGDSL